MKKNLFFLLLTFILIVPSFFSLLRPGYFPMQDDMQAFRLQQLDKCVKDGQIPCRWVPDAGYGYGYPQFNFYAPFVYYLGEVFHLVGWQFIDSVKILFILGFVLAGFAMFLFVQELFGGLPAVLAAVLFTYSPFRAQEVFVRGALSEFWAGVFFPLILWALLKLVKEGKRRYLIFSALSIAGLFITHNLLSFLFMPIVLLWLIYLFVTFKKTFDCKKVASALLLGFGVAAFFVLPMLLEMKYVHTETMLGGYFDYRQHFVSFKQLLFSNYWGYGSSQLGPNDDLNLSTGILNWTLSALALIAAFLTAFKKKRNIFWLTFFSFTLGLAFLFLIHQRSSFVWILAKPLSYLQFPWRLLIFSSLIFSFLGGVFISLAGKYRYLLGILIVVILFGLQVNFFKPVSWLKIGDKEKFSSVYLQKQVTASIFDYLPIYAKLPPEAKAPDLPEVLAGKAEFRDYFKTSDYQKGKLEIIDKAVIRLPLFDFPGMKVTLDNKEITHVNNNCTKEKFCLGLITFEAEAGVYDFAVRLNNTPLRSISNLVSLGSLMILVFLLFVKNEKIIQKD